MAMVCILAEKLHVAKSGAKRLGIGLREIQTTRTRGVVPFGIGAIGKTLETRVGHVGSRSRRFDAGITVGGVGHSGAQVALEGDYTLRMGEKGSVCVTTASLP
eukprot:Rmarinus@m.16166